MEGEWVGKETSFSRPRGHQPPRCHEFSRGSIKMTTVGVVVWTVLSGNIRKFSPCSLSCLGNVRTSPSYSSSCRWFLFQNPFPRLPKKFLEKLQVLFLTLVLKLPLENGQGKGTRPIKHSRAQQESQSQAASCLEGATGGFD